VDYAVVRAMLDEVGVPTHDSIGRDTLEMMKAGEKFESFFSPIRSCQVHDGKVRKTGQADEFIEYKIVGASYIIQFGYGIDGVRCVYVYPHCDLTKLRAALEPLVAQWIQELVNAEYYNALSKDQRKEYSNLPLDDRIRSEYLRNSSARRA